MAETQRPLRLLSLDGGGVRGLSSIMILQHIMSGVNEGRAEEDQLHPWQVFDMIGGTSTGGIIAIMLGRLHMSLDECEEAYLNLSRKIFKPKHGRFNKASQWADFLLANEKFDSARLEGAIKDCINSTLGRAEDGKSPEDALLKDKASPCKVFVCAMRQNNSELALLRSYKNPEMSAVLYEECRIWEACRATSAATTFFDPITMGKYGQVFTDGGILYNNPVQLVHREAANVWPARKALLISIGTGSAPGKPFKGALHTIVERMKEIVTQTERTANDFRIAHPEMINDNRLFRFNVTHGMADIGLEEYNEIGLIADATQHYLDNGETATMRATCVKMLSKANAEGKFTQPEMES